MTHEADNKSIQTFLTDFAMKFEAQIGELSTKIADLQTQSQKNNEAAHDEHEFEQEIEDEEGDCTAGNNQRVITNPNHHNRAGNHRVQRIAPRRREPNLPSITQPKINIPPFDGNDDPAVYIEWEDRVELLFQYCKIPDSEKQP